MHDLTVLVPSRLRPKNAVQLYEAFGDTCTADTKLIIIVDQDDPSLSTYYRLLNGIGQVTAVSPGRRGMVAALQSGYQIHGDQLGFAVGFLGDDHRPRTVGWDTAYLDTLRELGTGLVYGDDLFQHEAIPTQIAMTTDIPKTLGYICPPEFDHLCVDVVWNDWGKAIQRIRYLPGVVVEHVHYLAGKVGKDATYAEVNSSAMSAHDSAAYQEYISGNFKTDVAKLQKLVAPPANLFVNKDAPKVTPVPIEVPTVEIVSMDPPTVVNNTGEPEIVLAAEQIEDVVEAPKRRGRAKKEE